MPYAALRFEESAPVPAGVPGRPRAAAHGGEAPLRIGFVMEQVLGHVTWYENLRLGMSSVAGVEPRWVETAMHDPNGVLEWLPGVPGFVRASGRALIDARRGLRGFGAEVLLFNTQKAAAFCQWQMLRTPSMLMTDVTPVQYDRMADLYQHPVDGNPLLRAAKHRTNALNFRLARALLPSSAWARDSMIHDYGVPPERIHVIPVGADVEYWRPDLDRRAGDRVRLLFVGGHFERKGGHLLRDAFHGLGLADRAELHLVTRDRVEASPGVVVHNNMKNNSPELLRLYQEADVFVLPTLADCFGNASIEAMAAGLPVITTAMGGIPDIVEDGRTGYLLPPGDRGALATALHRLVDDASLRRAFGAAGRERAVTRFDARTNAGRIADLARSLRDERRGIGR